MSLEGDLRKIRKLLSARMETSGEIPTLTEAEERALRQLSRMYELALKAKVAEAEKGPKIVLNLSDVSVEDLKGMMQKDEQK